MTVDGVRGIWQLRRIVDTKQTFARLDENKHARAHAVQLLR